MTLEQAIEFCLHMKEEQYRSAHNTIIGDYPEYEAAPHFRLASEYKQIAEWLTELKELKATGCSSVKRGEYTESIKRINMYISYFESLDRDSEEEADLSAFKIAVSVLGRMNGDGEQNDT